MSDPSPPEDPAAPAPVPGKGLQNLKGLRLVIAIMAGYLLLAGLGVWIGQTYLGESPAADPSDAEGVASALMLAIGLMIPLEFVAFLAVRKSLRKQLDRDLDEIPYRRGAALPRTFVTICLIGAALTLGVGFFALVIFFISGSMAALAIAAGATVLLFLQIPTDDSLRDS